MRTGIILLCFLLPAAGCNHRPVAVKSAGKGAETIYKSGTAWRTDLHLPDGSAVLMGASSVVRIPAGFNSRNRDVFLEGEALFEVAAHDKQPFILHTRALITVVNSSTAVFKAEGFPAQPGEEVDLIRGELTVSRTYHSNSDNAAEKLHAGDMVMINTDIDLMEKEKYDSAELKPWTEKIKMNE
jgi:ferric-dicitrate binding protein FerR (iron transport regulator)